MKIPARWVRNGTGLVLGLGLLCGGFSATATAQGFRGGDSGRSFGGGGIPSPEDSFRRMDRNQNGQLDPDEIGFMREMYSRAGIDVSRPISQQEFIQASQKIREQFEQARSSGDFSQFRRPDGGGGGPPSFGGGSPSFGGGPPSFGGGPPGGSDRRSDESSDRDSRRDRDRRDDRESDRRGDSSSSSKSSKKTAKPKVRVTKDLPTDYRDKDKNGDGQIGLYEWDRKAFTQFFDLDRNGDGLLTADELIAAAKKSTTKSLTTTNGSTATAIASSSGSRSPAPSDFGKPSAAAAPAPASAVASTEMTAGMKVFVGLDNDRDGKLTEDEWQRSRTARGKFEKAGIAISLPIQQAQFVELYKQVEAK